MAQVPSTFRQEGELLDYTPGSAVTAGDTVVIGTTVVTIAPKSIAANKLGCVQTGGIWNVPKDNSDVAAGDALYWASGGTPVGGSAVGAYTKTAGGNVFGGIAIEAAGTTVGDVDMQLRSIDGTVPGNLGPLPSQTVAAAGSVQANATAITGSGFVLVTASDNTKGVSLPAAATGTTVIIKNSVTTAILKVYPAVDDKINAAAANAVYNQANGSLRVYVAYNAVDWFTDPETPT